MSTDGVEIPEGGLDLVFNASTSTVGLADDPELTEWLPVIVFQVEGEVTTAISVAIPDLMEIRDLTIRLLTLQLDGEGMDAVREVYNTHQRRMMDTNSYPLMLHAANTGKLPEGMDVKVATMRKAHHND